jgi:low temperature requirement protein LtrA
VGDVYTSAHMPILAGIIVSAAAVEKITLRPSDHVETPFRLVLLGGLALTVFGVAVASWRAFRVLPRERIAPTRSWSRWSFRSLVGPWRGCFSSSPSTF